MDNTPEDWHVTRIRVRYDETDQMGVVYHANYLVYFEVGRTELMRSAGRPYSGIEADGLQLVVVEANCAYRAPAKYDDEITVLTQVGAIKAVRLRFDYRILGPAGDLLVEGSTTLACVDPAGKPRRLPDDLLALLSSAPGA